MYDATDPPAHAPRLQACRVCGQIHRIPPSSSGQRLTCTRCGGVVRPGGQRARRRAISVALALTAFILYWPGILLPVVEIEKLGERYQAGILEGTLRLLLEGEWLVGMIVLLLSVIQPIVKISLLLEIGMLRLFSQRIRGKTLVFLLHLGRWGMFDVLLLALLVMLVRVGDLVDFSIGLGAVAFSLSVFFSILATSLLDTESIWEEA